MFIKNMIAAALSFGMASVLPFNVEARENIRVFQGHYKNLTLKDMLTLQIALNTGIPISFEKNENGDVLVEIDGKQGDPGESIEQLQKLIATYSATSLKIDSLTQAVSIYATEIEDVYGDLPGIQDLQDNASRLLCPTETQINFLRKTCEEVKEILSRFEIFDALSSGRSLELAEVESAVKEVFGLQDGYTKADLRRARGRMMLKIHPDKFYLYPQDVKKESSDISMLINHLIEIASK